jgi:hypothetical protein
MRKFVVVLFLTLAGVSVTGCTGGGCTSCGR